LPLRCLSGLLVWVLLAGVAAALGPPGPAALAPLWAAAAGEPGAVAFGRAQVTVESGGRALPFSVEVATTAEQRQRGLMYRRSLPADGGMLFVFPDVKVAHMWMKDTPLSLDLLFLGADGRVLRIEEKAEPLSLRAISSDLPARGVLELAAGSAARLGIRPGDRLVHPAFAPP